MADRRPKPQSPTTAAGVKAAIAARARMRRETQHSLTAIGAQTSRAPRNDPAPKLRFETRPLESLRPASRQIRRRDAK